MDDTLIKRFAAIVGAQNTLTGKDAIAPYVTDPRGRLTAPSPLVLRPANTGEVSAIAALASETGTAIIPQGGNTGLVGGGLPREGSEDVIVSLTRMAAIVDTDPATNTMVVEAGTILQNVQDAAADAGRLFPLSLGSQGSARIGGLISSNAGGTGVLAYGTIRDLVMGLEVVLADGSVIDGLSRLRKDNTGYDLRGLFVGAEGTLGIVTKAVLKLFPAPAGREVAYAAVKSPQAALDLLHRAQGLAGSGLTAFEFMSQRAMTFALRHSGANLRPPFADPPPWSVLIEISSGRSAEDARETIETLLSGAFEDEAITDAAIAQNIAQQDAFWLLREEMSWAQKPEGASIKHDIAVPVGQIPAFIEKADAAVHSVCPDARIVNFGHLGDGNLHYNITQPIGWETERFFELEEAIHDSVYEQVARHEGTISAEHGIGQIKKNRLAELKDPVALATMRAIKAALDPKGIMNPGKML
jgi:FAD/FMN-containing dehydrogenase